VKLCLRVAFGRTMETMHFLSGIWATVGEAGLLDLLKSIIERVLGWPVIALVLLLIFRRPLTEFLGRINGFKGAGLEVSATPPLASAQSDPKTLAPPEALKGEIGSTNPGTASTPTALSAISTPPPLDLEAVKKFGTGIPIVDEDVAAIKEQLAALKLPLDSEDTGEILVRHLAATQLMVRCERTHRVIFGSQIVALHMMNNSGAQPGESLRPLFENARAQEPKFYGAYTFEDWIGFLIKEVAVIKTDQNLYAITVYGQSYLNYIGFLAAGPKSH
jgi:hypothetical protein